MVRIITQETYDEVVKENIDEFEMSPEEAIKDAIAQFEAQGVNLTNIIKDLALNSGDDQDVTSIVSKLKELGQIQADNEAILKLLEALTIVRGDLDCSALLEQLDFNIPYQIPRQGRYVSFTTKESKSNLSHHSIINRLQRQYNELQKKAECNKDIARRVKAGKDGAYNILIDLVDLRSKSYIEKANEKDEKIIITAVNTLIALMEMQPDLLEQRGVDLIKSILDNIDKECIIAPVLRWASVCCVKHEMNRQRLFAQNVADNLKAYLKVRASVKIMSECMQVIRKLTLDDDVRVEFGKAHEHAKELGVELLEPLTQFLKEHPKPPEVSETMLTIAALLVRSELCALVAEAGADAALFGILADNFDCVAVVVQASKLITALAGNDDVKRKLVKAGIAPVIVTLLNRHATNPTAAGLILKCISALTLREPNHSRQFFDCGAPEAMVDAIKLHPTNASVQKNGCWAIRNMVARCREQNPKFHSLGVEAVLNAAYERFSEDFGFDVKSALRDLECDVRLDEQWQGTGVQMDNN